MIDWLVTPLMTGLLLGFLNSGHCFVMCGGLMIAVGGHHRPKFLVLYQLGRITTYLLLSLALSLLLLPIIDNIVLPIRIFSAFLLILLGFSIMGVININPVIEKLFFPLWNLIRPAASKQLTPNRSSYFAGILWGFLPCGLLYAILPTAVSLADLRATLSMMLGFGLGSSVVLITSGLLAQQSKALMTSNVFRFLSGSCIILIALATLWRLLSA